MTPESTGIIGIAIVQAFIFAKVIIDGKTKARESHLLSVEKGFGEITKRMDEEISRLRLSVDRLTEKLDSLYNQLNKCEIEKTALETRLLLLEKFRNIAASDDPTGRTKDAMPPPLEK